MSEPRPLRLAAFDLGVHLGCVCIDVNDALDVALVARRTIQVGEIVPLPAPVTHTRKDGSTWTQHTQRIGGPAAARAATQEATAWAVAMGTEGAVIEWIGDLIPGSYSPVLHAGQVGQSLHDALAGAGLPVSMYARQTALALVRRLAAMRGAPVLPGVVKHRASELSPVLDALVMGWAGSGPVVGRHIGARKKEASDEGSEGDRRQAGPAHGEPGDDGGSEVRAGGGGDVHEGGGGALHIRDGRREADRGGALPEVMVRSGGSGEAVRLASREDRRPEHEIDACAVALAHVATLAGVTVGGPIRGGRGGSGAKTRLAAAIAESGAPPMGWKERAKARRLAEGPDTSQRRDPAECKGCAKGVVRGPTHRRLCKEWRRVS